MTNGVKRYHLPSGWSLKVALQTGGALVFFTLFGPLFFAAGTMQLSVRCERVGATRAADCAISEGYIFGLIPLEREAHRATALHAESGRKGMSRLVFQTDGEPVPLLLFWSNVNDSEKSEVVAQLRHFFTAEPPPPSLQLRKLFLNVFALFGLPLTVVWLMFVWGLLFTPFSLLWPAGLRVDLASRRLALRHQPGRWWWRELRLDEVQAVEASLDPGGWMGKLRTAATSKTNKPKKEELHLHLVLRSGERVVLRNAGLSDDELRALAGDVAQTLGVPCRESGREAEGQLDG